MERHLEVNKSMYHKIVCCKITDGHDKVWVNVLNDKSLMLQTIDPIAWRLRLALYSYFTLLPLLLLPLLLLPLPLLQDLTQFQMPLLIYGNVDHTFHTSHQLLAEGTKLD